MGLFDKLLTWGGTANTPLPETAQRALAAERKAQSQRTVTGRASSGSWSMAPWLPYPSTHQDLREQAGDFNLNSAVMACINWIQRNFCAAPLCVLHPAAT